MWFGTQSWFASYEIKGGDQHSKTSIASSWDFYFFCPHPTSTFSTTVGEPYAEFAWKILDDGKISINFLQKLEKQISETKQVRASMVMW